MCVLELKRRWHTHTEGRGVKYRHVAGISPHKGAVSITTRSGKARSMRSEKLRCTDLDTEWHLITPWPIQESVSLLGWALWVISRHAHWTERGRKEGEGGKKKKKKKEQAKDRQKSSLVEKRKPFTCWLRTLLNIQELQSVPSDVLQTGLSSLTARLVCSFDN